MLGGGESWRQFHLRDQIQDIIEAVGLCHDSVRAVQLIPKRNGPAGVLHPVVPNCEISQFFARRPGIHRACSCLACKTRSYRLQWSFHGSALYFYEFENVVYRRRSQRWAPYLRDSCWLAILGRTADNSWVPDAPFADYYSSCDIPFSRLAIVCVGSKLCSRRRRDRRRIWLENIN